MTYLQGFCESQGENQPVKTDESSVIFSQIPLPVPKAKTALFRGLFFFVNVSPFLPCYNFIQCKGMRCASPNCDRCYGSRNSLLAPDFTVDFCFAKIAAATNPVSLRETGSLIPLPTPKIKNNRNQMVAVVLEWESHFCLIITLCCVKGYSAFHIFSTADAVPEKIVHSRPHSRFFLCKNRCCDEPCFAARNRFVNSFTRPKSKNSPLSRTVFVFWGG